MADYQRFIQLALLSERFYENHSYLDEKIILKLIEAYKRFIQLAYCLRKSVSDLPDDYRVVQSQQLKVFEHQALSLLEGVDVISSPERGHLVLECAIETGSKAIVKAVLDKVVDINAVDHEGRTALHINLKELTDEIFELFLVRGADVNAKDKNGQAAIHYATRLGQRDPVVLLLNRCTVGEKTPTAAALQQAPMLQLLGDVTQSWTIERKHVFTDVTGSGKGSNRNRLINLNAQDNLGNTALHYCVLFHTGPEILKLLIERGVDIRMKNKKEETAFQLAIKYVQNSMEGAVTAVDNKLDILYFFLQEEIKNNKEAVESCLASLKSSSKLNTRNHEGKTLLHMAVQYGHNAMVRILLQYKVDIGIKGEDTLTALHIAALKGDVEIAKLLLYHDPKSSVEDTIKYCSDINTLSDTNCAAIYIAARQDSIEIVQLILEANQALQKRQGFDYTTQEIHQNDQADGIYIDINVQDDNGITPLNISIIKGNNNLAKLLLSHNANVNLKTKAGEAPLHFAVELGNWEIASLLLSKGAIINNNKVNGHTALHAAVLCELFRVEQNMERGFIANYHNSVRGFKDMVGLLLKYGANLNAQSENGMTPLHIAIDFPLEICMRETKMLRIAAARRQYRRDNSDMSGLEDDGDYEENEFIRLYIDAECRKNLHNDPVDHELKSALIEIMLGKGADLYNKRDSDGYSVIELALRNGYEDIVKQMIKEREDVDYSDDKGRTVLMLAAMTRESYYGLVEAELNAGADVSKKDNEGLTALHHACSGNIVDLLLNRGANINEQSNDGSTPLHCALREASKSSRSESATVDLLDALFIASHRLNIKDNTGKTPIDYINELQKSPHINGLIKFYRNADIMKHITSLICAMETPTYNRHYAYGLYSRNTSSFDSESDSESEFVSDSNLRCVEYFKEIWICGICLYDVLNNSYILENLKLINKCAEGMEELDYGRYHFSNYKHIMKRRFTQAKKMPALLDKVSGMFANALSDTLNFNIPAEISHIILLRLTPMDLINLNTALQ